MVVTFLAEQNEHQKTSTKKESIKIISLMAEIYEEKIIEILPRILALISKRLKENDGQIHSTISETIGNVIGFGLKNLNMEQSCKHLQIIFKTFYSLFNTGNKYTQIGAAMSITKAIQSSPVDCLQYMSDDITWKIIEFLKSPNCKANLQLFESILSLILAVEENIPKLNESTKNLLPVIIDNMANHDWNVRKIAVEVIYTLSVLIPDILAQHKHALLDVLNHCRFDKVSFYYISDHIL